MRWIVHFATAMALGGCAVGPAAPDTVLAGGSVVFGYYDMTAAPSTVEWIALRSVDDRRAYRIAARDGFFYHPGVEPGWYRVEKFGGSGGLPLFGQRAFEYAPDAEVIRVGEADVHFLGAYAFVGRSDRPGFDLKPLGSPGERELLQRVARELGTGKARSDYARQLERVKRRLSEL